MAAVTLCSDFGAPKNKVCHCFPIYLPWSDGTRCHGLSFLNVELYTNFFSLLFHFHSYRLLKFFFLIKIIHDLISFFQAVKLIFIIITETFREHFNYWYSLVGKRSQQATDMQTKTKKSQVSLCKESMSGVKAIAFNIYSSSKHLLKTLLSINALY